MKRSKHIFKLKWGILGAFLLVMAGIMVRMAPAQAAIDSNLTEITGDCRDLYIIFARGSGESLNGPSEQAWHNELEKVLRPRKVNYEFYELGSERWSGFQYPAVAVAGSLGGVVNLAGAVVSAGESHEFGRSVVEGRGELSGYLSEKIRTCPNAKFILGGYSQGAMVISGTIDKMPADKILYAATFGDPKLYLPEGKQNWGLFDDIIPDACYGRNLSNYRIYVPDCYAYEGILGSYRPYQTADYLDKIGTWCNKSDIMCSNGSSLNDHTSYIEDELYRNAARRISRVLRKAYPDQVHTTGKEDYSNTELLIVLDQMTDSAERFEIYREQALRLAQKVLAGGGKVATAFYREQPNGYSASISQFDDAEMAPMVDYRIGRLQPNFWTEQDKKGKPGHSLLYLIQRAIKQQKWHDGATKSMVIFTDTECVSPSRYGVTLEDVVELSLSIDPVNIYVNSGSETITSYEKLVTQTNGKSFEFGTDFSLSEETILERPEAVLNMLSYTGLVGEEFYFDASGSLDANGEAAELQYDWDLDFDGNFELANADSSASAAYQSAQSGYIQVRVTDRTGNSSTMSAMVNVVTESPTSAKVSNLESVPLSQASAQVIYVTTGEKALLIVNDTPIGFVPAQGEFTLDQLSTAATVRIVSYDNLGQKGVASEVTALPLLPGVPNTSGLLRQGFWRQDWSLRVNFSQKRRQHDSNAEPVAVN